MKELTKDIINNTVKGYIKSLAEHLASVLHSFEPESIHRFRVEYKKFRAFVRMISIKPSLKQVVYVSKQLKAVYKTAGTIRDLQLQHSLILATLKQEHKKPAAYLAFLKEKIEKRKPLLADLISDASLLKHSRKIRVHFQVLFSEEDLRNYIRQPWAIVQTVISKELLTDKDLHDIRKRIKDLFYNMRIYEQPDAAIFLQGKWKQSDPVFFDNLLNELGKFQDYCTALSFLNKHSAGKFDKRRENVLQEIKKSWKTEKDKLGKLIANKIRTGLGM